jgi:4-hydroxyphenylpyruvate dioxygenase
MTNPLGIQGISFIELASPTPSALEALLVSLGFSRTHEHRQREVDLYTQNDIRVLLTREHGSHAHGFAEEHGPSVSAIGLRVENAALAAELAVRLGANEAPHGLGTSLDAPAIAGIGGSLVYFVGADLEQELIPHREPVVTKPKGFLRIDHLTNNVHKGGLERTARFYKEIFGFTELRAFDIRGERTGLYSYALRSPCGTFSLPINEGKEETSQIDEYLREYRGAGVQHIAFLTDDMLGSIDALGNAVPMLDIDPDYYRSVFERVPGVREDHAALEKLSVLVDGDEKGYLLQIFTQNVIGPIFFEFIQRRNHLSFGEGNFSALFRSIERDQERRGVFAT